MPRVTWHLGRWIRTTDWYPDYQLRLYDRRAAQWTGRYVHEAVTVRGAVGQLRRRASALSPTATSPIISRRSIATRRYAARQMHEGGRRASVCRARRPSAARVPAQLRRCAAASATARAGFVVSALNAYYVFLKFAKLWELQRCDTL